MKFIRLTDYRNGKPLWIRDDQVAAWFFDRGHYHVMTVFDSVDIEVKETGEQILAIMKGEGNGIQADDGKSVKPRVRGEVPEVQKFGG